MKDEDCYVLDLKDESLKKIPFIGASPSLRKNSFLFEDFLVASYDSENQRYFSIVGKEIHQKSANYQASSNVGDLCFDVNTNTVLDAIDMDQQGAIITIGHSKVGSDYAKTCGLREISNYVL